MLKAVKKNLPVDIAVCAAAVADFKPSEYHKNKLKKRTIQRLSKLIRQLIF